MPSTIVRNPFSFGESPLTSAKLNDIANKAADDIDGILYPDVEYTSLNGDGNPLTFTSNGVSYTCTYVPSGAAIGKISTVIGGGFTQTFTYDVEGNFESKVSTPIV